MDDIIEELDKKREIAISNNKKSLLRDEVAVYRLEETTLDYILYIIHDFAGKLV